MAMITAELVSHFEKPVRQSDGSYMCKCPAHDDKKQSLHITPGSGKSLMKCFAGCKAEDILAAKGLSLTDLYYPSTDSTDPGRRDWQSWLSDTVQKDGYHLIATYDYQNIDSGEYAFTKIRLEPKNFKYGIVSKGRISLGLKNTDGKKTSKEKLPAAAYGSIDKIRDAASSWQKIFYCEGEKDVETLQEMGCLAFTAGGADDWEDRMAPLTKDRDLIILADNDSAGFNLSAAVMKSCQKFAKSVKILIPVKDEEHADISDFFGKYHKTFSQFNQMVNGEDDTARVMDALKSSAAGEPPLKLKTLDEYEEREAEWLIHNFVPKGQITILAGDGGVGKSFLIANIIAAISAGKRSIFEDQIPFEEEGERDRQFVMFFSGEDTVPETMKRRVRVAGGHEPHTYTLSLEEDGFNQIMLGTDIIERLVAHYKPALVILDPLESFLPGNIQMNSRNTMRSLMKPLIAIGKNYGTSFIICMHTNKVGGAWGRRRIADSADMWDIARSVIMFGQSKDGFYCSHEKSNYGEKQQTILYKIEGVEDDAKAIFTGVSPLKDKDFVLESMSMIREHKQPARESVKNYIIDLLSADDEPMEVKDLDESCKAFGFSPNAIREAKSELLKSKKIIKKAEGFGEDHREFIRLNKNR